MEPLSHDPAAGAIGLQVVALATQGLASGAAATGPVTALAPAGADAVSMLAVAAFAAEGTAMLALNTAAQEEIARTGTAFTDIAQMYAQVDGETAGTLHSAGGRIAGQTFVGPAGGGGLLRAEMLPGAGGSAPRTPPLANLVAGGPVAGPAPTVPAASPTVPAASPTVPSTAPAMPAAVNAASTLLGAGAAPLSSFSSLGQGASAGGAGGPGLASSLAGNTDEGKRDEPGEQQPGERLV
ncbi:PE domain-containing protein [Mycobacterium sp. E3247]|uniref:PE domain-containing protein n=1 Tax=Mycobacterium sp. E3247 TaxID=1856864 RepID=UPI00080156C0|nr:PE domain-containing protein [Mycobacterium sp. E3247]OBH01031.1 hypothetical protein A9X04_27560 [Mycobacterium sp. E3247]